MGATEVVQERAETREVPLGMAGLRSRASMNEVSHAHAQEIILAVEPFRDAVLGLVRRTGRTPLQTR